MQWGGTAGTTGIDMEEQEAILTRYFRPDQVKKLMKEQLEVDESYSVLRVSRGRWGQWSVSMPIVHRGDVHKQA